MHETLIEPIAVADIFVCGLAEVEPVGGDCFRFTFFAKQGQDRVVVARIVAPAEAVPPAVALALSAITGRKMATCCNLLVSGLH